MILKFTQLLLNKLRLSNPWRYKVPFLISVPYWMVLASGLMPEKAAWGFLFSCITILGIAGFGYLLNDFTDQEEDRIAGKPNVIAGMNPILVGLLMLFFLALAILPWIFFFPVNTFSLILLGSEFLLFILYSLPPFRLKERGWWGILCDAGYAHALPAVLAGVTFLQMGANEYTLNRWYLWALASWQFVLGIRNILLHQLGDFEKDLKTGTQTQVTNAGKAKTEMLLGKVIMPLELILFAAFGLIISFTIPYFGLFYLFFLFQVWFKRKILWGQILPENLRQRLYIYLDDFYQEWIPIFILLALTWENVWFGLLLAVHILLFRNAIKTLAQEIWRQFAHKFRRNG